MIKVVAGDEFDVAKRTTAATKLNEGDTVLTVLMLEQSPEETVILQTEKGMFLRFPAADVPRKKKGAIGVRGIKIDPKDQLKAAYLVGEEERIIEEKERQIMLHRLKIASRDGKGVKK